MKGIYYVKRRGQHGMTKVTSFQTVSSRYGNSGTTTQYKFIQLFYIQEIGRRYQLLMMGVLSMFDAAALSYETDDN